VDVKGLMKIGYADERRYTRDERMNKKVTELCKNWTCAPLRTIPALHTREYPSAFSAVDRHDIFARGNEGCEIVLTYPVNCT
jgi:hypothetical protein